MDADTGSQNSGARSGLSWAVRAALMAGAAALGAVLYVVFFAASKPESRVSPLARYAVGEMAAMQLTETAPAQSAHPFEDAQGAPKRLADFRGRVVALNIWATNCTPCIAELPALAALQERYAARGLTVLAVSIDGRAREEKARAQLAELTGGALDFYLDPERSIGFALAAPGLPTTIVYDREGREIARLAGGADWDSADAHRFFEALL